MKNQYGHAENCLFDMDSKFLSIFIILIYVKNELDFAAAIKRFNYQKDMSEYCRRRVAPSVFLGKQVMEASSHIMHFSQLEMPYSCTLSVRAESGNDIILVIQLISEMDLLDACAQNADQLIIYEFGETFGGYWGHLPDTMIMKTTKNHTRFYTIKTTESTTITTTEQTTDYITDAPHRVLMHEVPVATDRPVDFIRMEVPLVNVTGNFQLGSPLQPNDVEDMFDFIYDVTPKNGVEYETSVVPLVQFSIKKHNGLDRYDTEQRYDIDYGVERATFDSRLLFNTANKKIATRKKKWPTSKRLNFRRKNFNRLFTAWSTTKNVKSRHFTKTFAPTLNSTAWKIEDIIKAYSLSTIRSTIVNTSNMTIKKILKNISNMDHNVSVYLTPNLSIFDHYNPFAKDKIVKSHQSIQLHLTTTNLKQDNLSTDNPRINKLLEDTNFTVIKYTDSQRSTVNTNFHVNSHSYDFDNEDKLPKNNKNESNFNSTGMVKEDNSSKDKTISNKSNFEKVDILQKGRMVDRESWENVVQAAPVMAVVLNRSEILSKNSTKDINKLSKNKRNKKKRHIHALEIENSRPRNLTTQRPLTMETEPQYQFSDLQDLAELVELQDDEISGRLALRYLRNYVGSALFNICDTHEAKSRYVVLFNVSRIVIAINNFTMPGMTIVLTPAQALLGSTSLCDPNHLECQVIGSRVCIDSMNACDGVPNCGSYDIYDEDRLMCGVTKGLQHNVYLAAFTFLAVILTMLYTIHYWLKRYVPRVSDAFFIYTDATENTLFLDTIMRSPNEDDETSYKFAYPENLSDADDLYKNVLKEDFNDNFCKRIVRKCCGLLLCKKKHEEISSYENEVYSTAPLNQPNVFSFAEYELRKLKLREEAVQTGESLELQITHEKEIQAKKHDEQVTVKTNNDIKEDKHAEELKLIKFTKDSRSSYQNLIPNDQKNSRIMARRHALIADDEKEIKSTLYERAANITEHPEVELNPEKISVKCEVHTERPKPKKQFDSRKRLRFDEDLTMIHVDSSTVLGRESHQDLDMITQEEPEASESRDFMRFWGTTKGKKGKKKKEKHLPPH